MSGGGRGRLLRPVSRNAFLAWGAAYLAVRLALLPLPGYAGDVEQYKEWALGSALHGLPAVYERTSADYPPVSLYVFYAIGVVYTALRPLPPGPVSPSILPTPWIKAPHLLFDLLLAGALYFGVARRGLWGRERASAGWGRLAALLLLWNPAVLFGSAWWGQLDGLHAFLAVAALIALASGGLARSGALLCLASLTKPLAAPLVPLLVATAPLRGGLRGFARAGLGGLAAALVVFAPFLLTGRIVPALGEVVSQTGVMAFTSANAHNVWWLVGGWADANAPWIGPLTPKILGLCAFALAYALLLARSLPWLRDAEPAELAAGLFVLAAAVSSAFFLLTTHLHENHLFLAVPLLLGVAGRSRGLARLALGCSLAVFFNELLHDPRLHASLPSFLGWPSPVLDPNLGRPLTWLQVWGSHANVVLVIAVTWGCCARAWRLRA